MITNAPRQSTLVEVITQDRPGLLHTISSEISRENCNIEIALIETEGQMAIDVFYLTQNGAKLSQEQAEQLARLALNEIAGCQIARASALDPPSPVVMYSADPLCHFQTSKSCRARIIKEARGGHGGEIW